jgi:hypothetical protein
MVSEHQKTREMAGGSPEKWQAFGWADIFQEMPNALEAL